MRHHHAQLSMGTRDTSFQSCPGCCSPRSFQSSSMTLPTLTHPAAYPKLDEKEGVLGPTLIELLEAAFLLGKLVVDLADVHGLQQRVAVRGVRLADVHEEVFAVL